MDIEERRYKVRQKNKYKDEYNETKKFKIGWSIATGFAALSCALGILNFITKPFVLALFLEAAAIGLTVISIVALIKVISKMTLLEIDIDKITAELEKGFELEIEKNNGQESVGKRR